jgi:hypothetical protein
MTSGASHASLRLWPWLLSLVFSAAAVRHLLAGAREDKNEPRDRQNRRGAHSTSLASTSVVKALWPYSCRSDSAQILGRGLDALPIGDDFEFDLLSFVQPMHPGALTCTNPSLLPSSG